MGKSKKECQSENIQKKVEIIYIIYIYFICNKKFGYFGLNRNIILKTEPILFSVQTEKPN